MAAPAFSAVTVDAATGEIIYSKDMDGKRYPASLTKVMTLYLLFEEIDAGRMSFSTQMNVSKKASLQQPSKLGLRTGGTISARDAMFALITKSANDAAMVVAEHIGGSQEAFAARMTKTARAIGMTRTTFTNPNGLPDNRQVTTARDMATLGLRIQRDFPQYYKHFATRSFKYGRRKYGNHNRLLGRVKGVDGIKTGYTRASGFNLISSRELNGRRIVGVVMGGRSGSSRNAYMTKILNRDIAKATRNGNRIAAVAGKPSGYNGPAPTPGAQSAMVAEATPSIRNAPIPRDKPEFKPAPEQQQIAAIVESVVAAPMPATSQPPENDSKPVTITQEAVAAMPTQGVTFASVVVPSSTTKTDSLIVANAARAMQPAPATKFKSQARIATQPTVKEENREPVKIAAGTKVIRDAAKIEARLAEHQSSWNIQIGAFPTQEGAKSRIDAAKARKVRPLSDATPFLMAVDKDGGTIYRARFSGLNTKAGHICLPPVKTGRCGLFSAGSLQLKPDTFTPTNPPGTHRGGIFISCQSIPDWLRLCVQPTMPIRHCPDDAFSSSSDRPCGLPFRLRPFQTENVKRICPAH